MDTELEQRRQRLRQQRIDDEQYQLDEVTNDVRAAALVLRDRLGKWTRRHQIANRPTDPTVLLGQCGFVELKPAAPVAESYSAAIDKMFTEGDKAQ